MKALNYFIKESLNGIPNRKLDKDNKQEYYDLADEQAQWLIDNYLKKQFPELMFETVDSADTKKNLTNGDIIVYNKNNEELYYIDLKVAEYGLDPNVFVGTIDLNSILNFANNSKSIYLCLSSNGKTVVPCAGVDVWKLFENNNEILLETKHKNRNDEVKKELEKYSSKIKNYSNNGVSPYDYLPSKPIKSLKTDITKLIK